MAILMCRPEYFGIEYEINPWMNVKVAVDHEVAVTQWQALYEAYRDLGETVELVDPVKGLPDMVFTANAGIVWGDQFVLSSFHHPERQGEEPYFKAVMGDLGYTVHSLDRSISFEGAGDGLFVGNTLFFGTGFRTDRAAHTRVAELLNVEVVSLDLVDARFYHLDTCFCPLNDTTVLFTPTAFTPESAQVIRDRVPNVIEVPRGVAEGFACNASPVGDKVISSSAIGELHRPLRDAGFDTVGLPMSEFMKSGGGVRCLTLPLDVGPSGRN